MTNFKGRGFKIMELHILFLTEVAWIVYMSFILKYRVMKKLSFRFPKRRVVKEFPGMTIFLIV